MFQSVIHYIVSEGFVNDVVFCIRVYHIMPLYNFSLPMEERRK